MTPPDRLSIEVLHNRETGEVRIVVNMPEDYACDLNADLARATICAGTHAVAVALRAALAGAGVGRRGGTTA